MNSTVINATIIALHYTSQMVIGINRSTVSILIDIQRGSWFSHPPIFHDNESSIRWKVLERAFSFASLLTGIYVRTCCDRLSVPSLLIFSR